MILNFPEYAIAIKQRTTWSEFLTNENYPFPTQVTYQLLTLEQKSIQAKTKQTVLNKAPKKYEM